MTIGCGSGKHMRKSRLIAMGLMSAALLWAGPALGEIYYQVDENGLAHFTNAPTTSQYRRLPPGVLPPTARLTAANISELIDAFAAEYEIDPALIRAVIQVESNFNRKAVSPKGAQGLMQLMPATIWRLSVGDAYDPHENIGAGVRYLRQLLDRFRGDLTLTLAAYNAGENAVLRYKGVPPYQETRDYVAKVMSLYRRGQREGSTNGATKAAAQTATTSPPAPPAPPQFIYKTEASGTALYSNIPPIIHSP